jgi:hypothetical protein
MWSFVCFQNQNNLFSHVQNDMPSEALKQAAADLEAFEEGSKGTNPIDSWEVPQIAARLQPEQADHGHTTMLWMSLNPKIVFLFPHVTHSLNRGFFFPHSVTVWIHSLNREFFFRIRSLFGYTP